MPSGRDRLALVPGGLARGPLTRWRFARGGGLPGAPAAGSMVRSYTVGVARKKTRLEQAKTACCMHHLHHKGDHAHLPGRFASWLPCWPS